MSDSAQKQIYESFLSETAELLAELEREVIKLEASPEEKETVDNIFRCLHSLKGNSSLLGLSDIKLFVHQMENMADKIRNRELEVTTNVINTLLEASDLCKGLFGRLPKEIENVPLLPEEEDFLERVSAITSPDNPESEFEALRIELLKFFSHPDIQIELKSNDALSTLANLIQEAAPLLMEDRRTVKAEAPSIFYKGLDVGREYLSIKSIIEEAKAGNASDTQYSIVVKNLEELQTKHQENDQNDAYELLESLREDLEMLYHDESGFDDVLAQITEEALETYENNLMKVEPETGNYQADGADKKDSKEELQSKAGKPSALQNGLRGQVLTKQIRVNQEKLDKAIGTAGELVTISEFFNYINSQILIDTENVKKQLRNFKDASMALQELSEDLSRELYDIRKVPIEDSLERLPRVVRDEQKALGKKVRLVIEGEDTPVDKGLVSKLETILVHMIRNSIDHGLGTPEERKQAGKPEVGTISITITSDDTMMNIILADDGKGINLEKLREKMIKSGKYDEKAVRAISDQELAEEIFAPGLSTASAVTETSGRGVGMDIVNSTIMEMGGNVKVDTKVGKGTSITLRFPLTQTTMVKKGLAVAVGKSVFLVPIEVVIESFRPSNGQITLVEGKAEAVHRRNEITQLVRLHRLFEIEAVTTDPYDAILLMVHHKKKKICFMVDSVIGQRQIIYKDLDIKTVRQPAPFEGVSVYDGSRLAMILDVHGIMEQAEK